MPTLVLSLGGTRDGGGCSGCPFVEVIATERRSYTTHHTTPYLAFQPNCEYRRKLHYYPNTLLALTPTTPNSAKESHVCTQS